MDTPPRRNGALVVSPGRGALAGMLLASLLWPLRAGAGADSGGVFGDDFEGSTLLTTQTPSGRWDVQLLLVPNVTAAAEPSAAHRGTHGLRIQDADTSAGAGASNRVGIRGLVASAPNYRMRFWFRANALTQGASPVVAAFATPSDVWPLALRVSLSLGHLELAGHDGQLAYSLQPGSRSVLDGQWHLVEAVLYGLGSPLGARRLYVDGVLDSEQSSVDLTGLTPDGLWLGEVYSDDRDFTGDLDFDDVRVAPTPQPSHLLLFTEATSSGACTPLEVSLHDSETRALSGAPYELAVSLTTTALSTTFYSDAQCTHTTDHVTLPWGSSSAQAYWVAAGPAAGSVLASHPDFLPATQDVNVGPGAPAGTPEPTSPAQTARRFGVGCASNATVTPWGLASLLGLLGLCKRRSPKTGLLVTD